MRVREPVVRKHVHRWAPYARAARIGRRGWSEVEPIRMTATGKYVLHRSCTDCGQVQHARTSWVEPALQGIPRSVWHLADVPWEPGIDESPDDQLAITFSY